MIGLAQCEAPMDADTVADGLVRDLAADDVAAWADVVRTAIASARAASQGGLTRDDERKTRRQAILGRINELQRQLDELDRAEASAQSALQSSSTQGDER
jgi:hypothetical protein